MISKGCAMLSWRRKPDTERHFLRKNIVDRDLKPEKVSKAIENAFLQAQTGQFGVDIEMCKYLSCLEPGFYEPSF